MNSAKQTQKLKTRPKQEYTRQDFVSSQEVRWCPGCGDYSILMSLQKAMPLMNRNKEEFVVISGIGCAARLPYYVDTYGFHSIHGRATSIASGVKVMQPNLSVWVITGDGDSFSIGLGHLLHTIRKNIGIRILMFNNAIYGLTKGQASPTSRVGTVTKSTPFGHLEKGFSPLKLVDSANGTFIARTADVLTKHSQSIFVEAEKHIGTAFVEVLQNCPIFHDGAFQDTLQKETRDDRILYLEENQPMLYGKEKNKGIIFDKESFSLKSVSLDGANHNEILVHKPLENSTINKLLTELENPLPIGIVKRLAKETLENSIHIQEQEIQKKHNNSIMDFIYSGETWEVR